MKYGYYHLYFHIFYFILYSLELHPYKATDVGRATYNGITKFETNFKNYYNIQVQCMK